MTPAPDKALEAATPPGPAAEDRQASSVAAAQSGVDGSASPADGTSPGTTSIPGDVREAVVAGV